LNTTAFFKTPALVNVNDELSLPVPVNAYVNVSPKSTSNPVKVPIVLPVGLFSCNVLLLNVKPYGVSF